MDNPERRRVEFEDSRFDLCIKALNRMRVAKREDRKKAEHDKRVELARSIGQLKSETL